MIKISGLTEAKAIFSRLAESCKNDAEEALSKGVEVVAEALRGRAPSSDLKDSIEIAPGSEGFEITAADYAKFVDKKTNFIGAAEEASSGEFGNSVAEAFKISLENT